MLLLQGCVITRILETVAQLCEAKPPQVVVVRQPGSGVRVSFKIPTLSDRDVVTVIGYDPSQRADAGGVRKFAYEAVPLGVSAGTHLILRLTFTPSGDEYRLAELEIPEEFNAVLPAEVIDAAIAVVCKPKLTFIPPSVEFSLAPVDRRTLPNREQVRQLLGPPTATAPQFDQMAYEYCLAPCGSRNAEVAQMKFVFGNAGDLRRIAAHYFRYSANVDFAAQEPRALIALD